MQQCVVSFALFNSPHIIICNTLEIMFIVTSRDFPHALSQDRISMTVSIINGISSIINTKTASNYESLLKGVDYQSISAREAAYKKYVVGIIQHHVRLTVLSSLTPVTTPSDPVDEELTQWYALVDACTVVPKPSLKWHHHPDGSISWTLVSITWFSTTSDCKASTVTDTVTDTPAEETSNPGTDTPTGSIDTAADIDTISLPEKLDTAETRTMFKKFIDEGRIEIAADGHLRWKVANHSSKCPVALAYFITKASDYLGLTVVGPSGLPRYRRKELETLFGVSGSTKKTSSSIAANTRKEIDAIFKKLPPKPNIL